MRRFVRVFTNRNFIFILSIVLGLTIRNVPEWIKHFTVPALAIVMIVSLTQISLKSFLDIKVITKPILYSILFNYIIFGVVMLALARFLIIDRDTIITIASAGTVKCLIHSGTFLIISPRTIDRIKIKFLFVKTLTNLRKSIPFILWDHCLTIAEAASLKGFILDASENRYG